jgi:DNA-binding NtrC family response regulator
MRAELAIYNLESLREAALTLLREVESLSNRQQQPDPKLGLQEEVQRYETELIRDALQRTRGNQRRAARLLGVKVTTLNCKIKRLGIQYEFEDFS